MSRAAAPFGAPRFTRPRLYPPPRTPALLTIPLLLVASLAPPALAYPEYVDSVACIAWSPDGGRIATALGTGLIVWNSSTGAARRLAGPHPGGGGAFLYDAYCDADWSPDGSVLAAANGTRVGLWSAPGLVKHSSAHALDQRFVEWTSDGSHIITGSGNSTLTLWSTGPLREIESIKAGNGTLMALSLPSRGTLGLALLSGGRILLFNQTDLGPFSSIEPAPAPSVAALAPDASFILAGGEGGELLLLTVPEGAEAGRWRFHGARVTALDVSTASRLAAAGYSDGTLVVFDYESGAARLTLRADRYGVTTLAFSPDGRRLASAGVEDLVRVWDAETGRLLLAMPDRSYPPSRALLFLAPGAVALALSAAAGHWRRRELARRRGGELYRQKKLEAHTLAALLILLLGFSALVMDVTMYGELPEGELIGIVAMAPGTFASFLVPSLLLVDGPLVVYGKGVRLPVPLFRTLAGRRSYFDFSDIESIGPRYMYNPNNKAVSEIGVSVRTRDGRRHEIEMRTSADPRAPGWSLWKTLEMAAGDSWPRIHSPLPRVHARVPLFPVETMLQLVGLQSKFVP